MFYEDYRVRRGDSISGIAKAYGYKALDWKKIWEDPGNSGLIDKRGTPENIQPGDQLNIPIPWRVVTKQLTGMSDGAQMVVERDGELGKQLTWVQTVYQHNQPAPSTQPYCVDGCPADDDLPFYWTNSEIASDPTLRKRFIDRSRRPPPSAAQGTTKWRAVVSLAVVTEKRVTVWNSLVWGWNMETDGTVTTIGPRAATLTELDGHLNLLRKGIGTGPLTFGKAGWTFREAQPVRRFNEFISPRSSSALASHRTMLPFTSRS